ncbi:MAG TPA: integrase [Epsilonproteobacteria bacterium]|nr:integrase [Campylobacterota bacterium]
MINLPLYIDDFLNYLEQIRGYSPQTVITYQIALDEMVRLSHIENDSKGNRLDITQLRMHIIKNNKKTIAKKLSAIRSFVKYLENQRQITLHIHPNDSIKVPKTLPKPVKQNHIHEVLKEASLQEQLIIEMLYGLGLRISELSSLKLDSIKNDWVNVVGKGNKTREVPLLAHTKNLLERYKLTYRPKIYLFEKGNAPLNSSQIRYRLTNCFKRHGIKMSPHQLRHSFATHLLDNGARIADVSELLGHSTMATTQIYTKLSTSKKLTEYLKAHPLAQPPKLN